MPVPPARPVVSVSRKTASDRSKPSSSGFAGEDADAARQQGAESGESETSPCNESRWHVVLDQEELAARVLDALALHELLEGGRRPGGSRTPRSRRAAAAATRRSSRSFRVRRLVDLPEQRRSSPSRSPTASRDVGRRRPTCPAAGGALRRQAGAGAAGHPAALLARAQRHHVAVAGDAEATALEPRAAPRVEEQPVRMVQVDEAHAAREPREAGGRRLADQRMRDLALASDRAAPRRVERAVEKRRGDLRRPRPRVGRSHFSHLSMSGM